MRTVPGLVLLLVLAAAPVPAQDEAGWSYDAWNELMSPFCPGRSLADCPSPQAENLRAWIVEQERAGRSRAEVTEELYGRFGDVLRSAPRPTGIGLTAYLIPLFAFLAGGTLVAVFLRRQGARVAAAAPDSEEPPALDPEALRLIDEELEAGEAAREP